MIDPEDLDSSVHWESELPSKENAAAIINPLSSSVQDINISANSEGKSDANTNANNNNFETIINSSNGPLSAIPNRSSGSQSANGASTSGSERQEVMDVATAARTISPIAKGVTSSGTRSPVGSSPKASELDSTIVVSIGNPQKHGDSIKDSYTSYEIVTRYKSDPNAAATGRTVGLFKVRRRYQEFVWLQHQISADYPACICPPLPEKQRSNYLDRFSVEFIERRMASLERFLQRLVSHPVLRKSETLKIFLEKEFIATDGGRRDSIMENISEAVINVFSKLQKPDERFINYSLETTKLESHLKNVDKSQASVLQHMMDLSDNCMDLVPSLNNLAHMEKDLFDILIKLASAHERIHASTKEFVESLDIKIHGVIREYIQYCKNAKYTLKTRDQKQSEMEDLSEFLRACIEERDKVIRTGDANAGSSNPISHFINKKMDEFKGVDPDKARQIKLAKLETKVTELQKAAALSKETNQQFNDRLVQEFDILKEMKERDFKNYMKSYADSQYQYHSKVADELRALHDLLDV